MRICVYNGFDGWTESNCITIEPIPAQNKEETFADEQKNYREIIYDPIGTKQDSAIDTGALIAVIIAVSFIVLFMLILLIVLIRMLLLLMSNKKYHKKQ